MMLKFNQTARNRQAALWFLPLCWVLMGIFPFSPVGVLINTVTGEIGID